MPSLFVNRFKTHLPQPSNTHIALFFLWSVSIWWLGFNGFVKWWGFEGFLWLVDGVLWEKKMGGFVAFGICDWVRFDLEKRGNMLDFPGTPGTLTAFVLRILQCVFAAGSVASMATAVGFYNFTAFWYLLILTLLFSFFWLWLFLIVIGIEYSSRVFVLHFNGE